MGPVPTAYLSLGVINHHVICATGQIGKLQTFPRPPPNLSDQPSYIYIRLHVSIQSAEMKKTKTKTHSLRRNLRWAWALVLAPILLLRPFQFTPQSKSLITIQYLHPWNFLVSVSVRRRGANPSKPPKPYIFRLHSRTVGLPSSVGVI